MFFPEKIKSIKDHYKVLEIGPGGSPHPRANVLLELKYNSKSEAKAQRGNAEEITNDKRLVYYNGGIFPFKDKEFDYVICSHVLEHVNDVEPFLNEIYRVGKSGYFEFPLVYYDYVYNFPEHLNFIYFDGKNINWMPKSETPLKYFNNVQRFFYKTMEQEYFNHVESLKEYLFQGFEWNKDIPTIRVNDLDKLSYNVNDLQIPKYINQVINYETISLKKHIIFKLKNVFNFFFGS